jgi:hypothetical protein
LEGHGKYLDEKGRIGPDIARANPGRDYRKRGGFDPFPGWGSLGGEARDGIENGRVIARFDGNAKGVGGQIMFQPVKAVAR